MNSYQNMLKAFVSPTEQAGIALQEIEQFFSLGKESIRNTNKGDDSYPYWAVPISYISREAGKILIRLLLKQGWGTVGVEDCFNLYGEMIGCTVFLHK